MGVVYFLGAGAARPCGYHTTPELYRNLMGQRAGIRLFKEFGDALSETFRGEPIDIEVLYTLAMQPVKDMTSAAYARFDQSSDGQRLLHQMLLKQSEWGDRLKALQEAFVECREVIIEFIREMFWEVDPDLSCYDDLHLLETVARGATNVDIFTTNYDTSIEDYLADKVSIERFVTGNYLDVGRLQVMYRDRPRLIKLHGSIDFYRLNSGKIAHIHSFMRPGPWKAGEVIEGPYIVPPLMGDVKYDDAQVEFLQCFKRAVASAEVLIIIGSSFRDEVITRILSGAPKNASVLIACGSRSDEIADRWFPYHERVVPTELHFPNRVISDWIVSNVADYLTAEGIRRKTAHDGPRAPRPEKG